MTAIQLSTQQYFDDAYTALKKEMGTENQFALPKIEKIVINTGVGKFEKGQREEIVDLLERLTGQIPKQIQASTSVSAFKLRAGELNGVAVTLRGQKMKDFLLNLVYISLPRTKDFKGLKKTSWTNDHSTYSIGISDASIFPQIGFNAKVNFGLQVNISFVEGSENNVKLLEALNFPFQKSDKK